MEPTEGATKEDGVKRIGLTGGIASGKSVVSRLLAAQGVPVVDADRIARDVVKPGTPALAQIAERWPGVIVDGSLDRKALGKIVFADPDERLALEAIVHPRIREESVRRLDELEKQGVERAIYEAPLLVENQIERNLDALILVSSPVEAQVERLMARDGLSEEEARARVDAQLPLEAKLAKATFVIENVGSMQELEAQTESIWREVERRY